MKTISASRLENYFHCPFASFLANTLNIKPRKQADIQAVDIGNVLHEIMFKYYKLNKKVGDVYDFCKDEIFAYLDTLNNFKINLNSHIITNLIDEAVRAISALNYIDENSQFVPSLFEHEFSNKNSLKLKNVEVIGKVDRVDFFENTFRVVDYKSGKADASLAELYSGDKLQLFLYSCAIENELKRKSVGAFYLPLHNEYRLDEANPYALNGIYLADRLLATAIDKRIEETRISDISNLKLTSNGEVDLTTKSLTDADFNNLKEYAKSVSEKAVEEIRSGYIKPSPSDRVNPCTYCAYAHICMHKTNGLEARKLGRVTTQSFKEGE